MLYRSRRQIREHSGAACAEIAVPRVHEGLVRGSKPILQSKIGIQFQEAVTKLGSAVVIAVRRDHINAVVAINRRCAAGHPNSRAFTIWSGVEKYGRSMQIRLIEADDPAVPVLVAIAVAGEYS